MGKRNETNFKTKMLLPRLGYNLANEPSSKVLRNSKCLQQLLSKGLIHVLINLNCNGKQLEHSLFMRATSDNPE